MEAVFILVIIYDYVGGIRGGSVRVRVSVRVRARVMVRARVRVRVRIRVRVRVRIYPRVDPRDHLPTPGGVYAGGVHGMHPRVDPRDHLPTPGGVSGAVGRVHECMEGMQDA